MRRLVVEPEGGRTFFKQPGRWTSDEKAMRAAPRYDLRTAKLRWIDAQRFKARVHHFLAPEHVSFTQWLVLEALADDPLYPPYNHHQADVADAIGVSERVVSYTVAALCRRGLVDHREEFVPQYESVLLTEEGHKVLRACRQILQDAVNRFSLALVA